MARRGMAGMIGACLVLGVAMLGGCVKNAATGKSIFTMGMPASQQIALGAQAAPEFTKQYGGTVKDAQACAYVTDVGRRLAAQTEGGNPDLPWEFTFLDSDVVNAFALPGGKVFFTRGLASRLTSEAQMAGVIGHEVGHVTAEHGAQRIAQTTALQTGIGVAAVIVDASGNEKVRQGAALGIPALQVGGQLVVLRYGRAEELEADSLGMRYMTRLGYNPAAQGEVMQVLKSLSAGGQKQPEILSTHPEPDRRIEQVNALLKGEYAHTQGNAQFQDHKDEYRARMLSRLGMLAPAPDSQAVARAYAQLGPPELWCSHCRADAEKFARADR